MRRLRALPPPANDVAQDFVDTLFRRLDASLRELGVGDMGVGKRMKKLARSFYGRAQAYDEALDSGDAGALAEALGRNALGTGEPASALAAYVLACDRALAGQSLDDILGRGPVYADAKETPR
jgi:cytochrome b pre-mRNA-processing protein 3